MMDNIEKVLENIFRRVSVENILENVIVCDRIEKDDFIRLMRSYSDQYSDTELANMYNYLSGTFLQTYYPVQEWEDKADGLNVFELLKCYSEWILTIQGNEIVCEYHKLLHWRMITTQLSEDLFATSFLAQWDLRQARHREKFGWKPFITHNNEELKKIINQGICENHFHLKGSAPIFQLSWISIMNNILSSQFADTLAAFDSHRREVNKKYYAGYQERDFLTRVVQAALIRVYLVSLILGSSIKIGDYEESSNCTYEDLDLNNTVQTEKNIYYYLLNICKIEDSKYEIQKQINLLQSINLEMNLPDYALHGVDLEEETGHGRTVFEGERWFLYEMFRAIYGRDDRLARYQNLFYAYIVIKENLRAELIQSNSAVGFENFRIYQDRKESFLGDSFYNNMLVREAVQSSLIDSNVITLEARIAPSDSTEKLKKKINSLDQIIDVDKYGDRCFYVIHFIKDPIKEYRKEDRYKCRHFRLREDCRKQAIAISELRQLYPQYAQRIKGIDAANTEIGCGPEVFAQIFRFLSGHIVNEDICTEKNTSQLKMTYHVGEDFLDVVSGLRAIDEAINFLGLGCGSRIGHALALGVDVKEWYQSKNYRVVMSMQEFLDNIVWLHNMIRTFKIDNEQYIAGYLEKEYTYYFNLIYSSSISFDIMDIIFKKARNHYKGSRWESAYEGQVFDFGIENYYRAWKLRGDNPEAYKEGYFDDGYVEQFCQNNFESYFVNDRFPQRQEERYFKETGFLYHLYHYSQDVRRNGERCIEKKLSLLIIDAIEQVQKGMQRIVVKSGVAIETNPSSNFLIGTFKRYDKHPLTKFYNIGLTNNVQELERCPQINVSINTDDQGVFNVSLENEYAYMALALEKMKDNSGNKIYKRAMIYEWLDNIRKMGIRQTFLEKNEMERAKEAWRKSKIELGTEENMSEK